MGKPDIKHCHHTGFTLNKRQMHKDTEEKQVLSEWRRVDIEYIRDALDNLIIQAGSSRMNR